MIPNITINLILLILIATLNFLMAVVVYFQGEKNRSTIFFSISALSSFLWVAIAVIRYSAYTNASFLPQSLIYTRLSLIFALSIFFFFLLFSFSFLEDELRMSKWLTWLLSLFYLAGITFSLTTDTIIISEEFIPGRIQPIYEWGTAYFYFYTPLLLFYFILSIRHLYRLKSDTKEEKEFRQLQYVLWGSGIAGTFGLLFGLIIASFPAFIDLFWIGRLSNGLLVLFATFAIFKYQLFNIKVVTTELLTFSIWFILLIRTITSESPENAAMNWGLLAFITIFGLLLIRSVRREVKARQRLEKVTTNLKHANARLKKMDKQKSQMLSIASHQFRSPLTAIQGYASLLKDGTYGKIPDKMKEPLSRILESSSNLANIVNDFLNISRIERGSMEYNFEIVDISEIIQKAVNEAQPTTGEEIDLSLKYDAGESFHIEADIGKIRQVITNLIDNAIKYTPQGEVEVQIKKVNDGDAVRVAVADTGVGIAKDDQMKIFEQFTRAKNANDVNVMGTGLGLYVAKQIVDAHEGHIWVESAGKGEGATFYVQLNTIKKKDQHQNSESE